jgi:hypothetical protein
MEQTTGIEFGSTKQNDIIPLHDVISQILFDLSVVLFLKKKP